VLTSKLLVGGLPKTTGSSNNGPTFDQKTTGQQQHLGTERPVNMAIVLKKNEKYFSWVKVS